jgi:hypothetical protein
MAPPLSLTSEKTGEGVSASHSRPMRNTFEAFTCLARFPSVLFCAYLGLRASRDTTILAVPLEWFSRQELLCGW